MPGRRLEIVIAGDASSAVRAFGQIEKSSERVAKSSKSLGQKMAGASEKMGRAGTKLTLGATLPIIALGKHAFDAASALGEAQNKVDVVFGKSAKDIRTFAKSASKDLGLSQRAALQATGDFGNLFRAMKLGLGPAAKMSKGLVKLSADLASFNDADPEEVLLALRSGLVGETEPLRRFGVQLSAARIQAEALSSGLVETTVDMAKVRDAQLDLEEAQNKYNQAIRDHGRDSLAVERAKNNLAVADQKLKTALEGQNVALTDAQKAQAAYQVIMKDTALAQGDFARTADSAANAQRVMKAQLEDASAAMGEKLIPIGLKAIGMVSSLATKFTSLTDTQQTVVLWSAGVVAALGPVTKATQGLMFAIVGSSGKGGVVGAFGLLARHPVIAVLIALAGVFALLTVKVTGFREALINLILVTAEFFNQLREIGVPVLQTVQAMFRTIVGFVDDLIDKVREAIDLVATLGDKLPGGKGLPFKDAPGFGRFIPGQHGGLIEKPTMMLAGEAGRELLLPLKDRKRSMDLLSRVGLAGGPQIVVHASTNANPQEIGREVLWALGRV